MRKADENFRSSVLEKSEELRQLGTQKNKGKKCKTLVKERQIEKTWVTLISFLFCKRGFIFVGKVKNFSNI